MWWTRTVAGSCSPRRSRSSSRSPLGRIRKLRSPSYLIRPVTIVEIRLPSFAAVAAVNQRTKHCTKSKRSRCSAEKKSSRTVVLYTCLGVEFFLVLRQRLHMHACMQSKCLCSGLVVLMGHDAAVSDPPSHSHCHMMLLVGKRLTTSTRLCLAHELQEE